MLKFTCGYENERKTFYIEHDVTGARLRTTSESYHHKTRMACEVVSLHADSAEDAVRIAGDLVERCGGCKNTAASFLRRAQTWLDAQH